MFATPEIKSIYSMIKPHVRQILFSLNELNFHEIDKAIKELKTNVIVAKGKCSIASEKVLNESYIIDRFIDMLDAYSEVWSKIFKKGFSASWNSLQDALDYLRLIKRLSGPHQSHDTDYFENQLLELEKLYPYKIFCSIGIVVDWFKCSICGKDIDSFDCPHRKGEVYQGQMAHAIAQNITEIEHVALVAHPEDKRCVLQYDDGAEQFKAIRYLADLIQSHKIQIFHFNKLEFSKKIVKNPNFKKMNRNKSCYCGSGKKFKKCCITREFIETDHIEIVARPVSIDKILL